MARFRLAAAFVVGGYKRYRASTVLADSVANAQPGDVVWTGMNSVTIREFFVPLDASASAMFAASQYAGTPAPTAITGADSIDG
jgi:hypothetical protein